MDVDLVVIVTSRRGNRYLNLDLADGIGGGPHGALAAEIVVEVVPSLLRSSLHDRIPSDRDGVDALPRLNNEDTEETAKLTIECLIQVSDELRMNIQHSPGVSGLGSTGDRRLKRTHFGVEIRPTW